MKKQTGFTLIELMIAVAIVAILAAVALPAYRTYVGKSKTSELRLASEGLQTQVTLCILDNAYKDGDTLTNCANGKSSANGVPWEIKAKGDYKTKFIKEVDVTGGLITVTSDGTNLGDGGASVTYIMKPAIGAAGQVDWAMDATSSCKTAGFC